MPTIYDNINEILSTELNSTIGNSFSSDFCVGYFNLRGWKNVADLIENYAGGEGNECRLIVGMQRPEEKTLKEALSNLKQGRMDNANVSALKKQMAKDFRLQLTFGIPSNDDEKALQQLESGC